MTPGTIFISHRSEYASLVRSLKKAIRNTSGGKIRVFISEDIPPGQMWRSNIEARLDESENLFLLYGAPYEDWSWCFYEAGFFASLVRREGDKRQIHCIARPNVPAPGPLSHLQMVTDKDLLIKEILDIYVRNNIDYDAEETLATLEKSTQGLFGHLAEYNYYPLVSFTACDSAFAGTQGIPSSAILSAGGPELNSLFGIAKPSITWAEMIQATRALARSDQEILFVQKWLEETSNAILAARNGRFVAPQTVLISPGGKRSRFLLFTSRTQGDGIYRCDFLAVEDVGGPTLGLPDQLLSLLTSIRMGFRFRYEFIQKFAADLYDLSDEDRRRWVDEIPRVIGNLTTESELRGNVNLPNLLSAFDFAEQERLQRILGYWPRVQRQLYRSLGLGADGTVMNDQGLIGANIELFQKAYEAACLLNLEFLSRCCNRASKMMTMSEDELKANAAALSAVMKDLARLDAPATNISAAKVA